MRLEKLLHQAGILLGAVVLAGAAVPANAVTIVAGTAFADNAFADTAVYGPFSFGTGGCGGAVTPGILIGPSLADCVFANAAGAYATVGFTDNVVVNGLGDDVRIYELGTADNFGVSLTIGGTSVTKTPIFTGFTSLGFNVNAANWDLGADFGLGAGATVDSLVLNWVGGSQNLASLTVIGALNSAGVPEPGLLWLLGLGLVLMGVSRRHR